MSKKPITKKNGRPFGVGPYGEKTVPIRIPLTLVSYVNGLLEEYVNNGLEVQVVDENGYVYTISKDA